MYTPTFISFLLYTFTKTNKQVFRGVSIIHNYSWIKKKWEYILKKTKKVNEWE